MSKKVKCPNCGTEAPLQDNPFRPFCSERCKSIDLGSWADEKYSLPGKKGDSDEEGEMWDGLTGPETCH